jgi:hypothetical protein
MADELNQWLLALVYRHVLRSLLILQILKDNVYAHEEN